MTSKLYIASKPAVSDALNPQHLYLVYDPDGNPNSGDEYIIRGGPPAATTGFNGFISVEIAQPIMDSQDGPVSEAGPPYTLSDLPPVSERNYTLLEEGTAADALWATMIDFAISLSNDENAQAGGVYGTDFTYAPTNSNSNSTVASVLAGAGLSVNDYLPVKGGDLNGDGIRDLTTETERITFANVPGAHVLLSGGESNTFAGYGRGSATQANVFFDTADADGDSGNDVFYGGALNNKIAKNDADGKDAYFYIQPGPSERLTFSPIRDGSDNHIGNKVETPDGKYDELYSIEIIGNRTYDNTHAIMYQFNAGLQIRDLSPTELASLNSDFGNEFDFETALEVDFGNGVTTQFANFGDIITSEHDDTLALNTFHGRTLDGGDGMDTVDYSAATGALYINMNPDYQIAYAVSNPGVTDSLTNIEHVVGAWDYSNHFQGALNNYIPYDLDWDLTLTYEGGNEADLYAFDISPSDPGAEIPAHRWTDTGSVVIKDNGANGTDIVRIDNMESDHEIYFFGEQNIEGVDYEVLAIFNGTIQALDLFIQDGAIELLEFGNYTISWPSLKLWKEFHPDYGEWFHSLSGLYSSIHNGPVSSGADYGNNITPDVDGSGNIAGMATDSAIGGHWTDGAVASEQQHGWVLTEQNTANGYSSFDAETYVKEISFAAGITAADLRFTASNSPSGDANLTIHVDSLSYALTITDFEAGREIDGVGLYDMDVHGDVQAAEAVAVRSTSAGHYTVQYEGTTAFTTASTSITYYLEKLLFNDSTFLDLQNAPITFTGTASGEKLYGLNSRDDEIFGLAGVDTLYGYGGHDVLHGGDGNDRLQGGDGNDHLLGGADNDTIYGEAGNDTLNGGAGRDALYGDEGDDLFVFGAGFGVYTGSTSTADVVNESLNEGTDTVWFTDDIAPEDLYRWTDSSGNFYLQMASSTADTLYINGKYSSSTGIDIGSYVEYVTFDDETVWDLSEGLHLRNNDTGRALFGSALNDIIEGGAGKDTIRGFDGNDTIMGHGGNDTLYGGAGDDLYVLGADFSESTVGVRINEDSQGGAGTDTLWLTDGVDADDFYSWTDTSGYLWLQKITDSATNTVKIDGDYSSSNGVDVGSIFETITFDDESTLDLTQGLHLRNNDTARTLYGSAQNDVIEGGAANDTLRGFAGDDWLTGHGGNDALWGYDGADTFAFMAADVGNGIDTLRDFDMTEGDVIDLRDVLDGGYDPMTDALADFVQFTNDGDDSVLAVDLDGAGTVYGWTQIATVYDHNNLDADVLATNGYLLAA